MCTAIFNSEYFEETLDYPPSQINWVNGTCEKRTVSFRTEKGKAEATGRNFEEWMLDCKPTDQVYVNFEYFLSQAYKSNELFVYFWESDEVIFPENLGTNVRIIVR